MFKIIFDSGTAIAKTLLVYKDDVEEEHEVGSLVEFLNCQVELKPGTTFAHVWRYIERDAQLFGRIFHEAMGGFAIEIYIEQAKKPGRNPDDDEQEKMTGLELYWDAEKWEGEIRIHPAFDGYGPIAYDQIDGTKVLDDNGSYGLDFSPINDLLELPLRINKHIKFLEQSAKATILLEGEREWTVYDLLFAILYEITWHGTPENQIREVARIDQSIAEAKDELKSRKSTDADIN